jgi:hypothetical protein
MRELYFDTCYGRAACWTWNALMRMPEVIIFSSTNRTYTQVKN